MPMVEAARGKSLLPVEEQSAQENRRLQTRRVASAASIVMSVAGAGCGSAWGWCHEAPGGERRGLSRSTQSSKKALGFASRSCHCRLRMAAGEGPARVPAWSHPCRCSHTGAQDSCVRGGHMLQIAVLFCFKSRILRPATTQDSVWGTDSPRQEGRDLISVLEQGLPGPECRPPSWLLGVAAVLRHGRVSLVCVPRDLKPTSAGHSCPSAAVPSVAVVAPERPLGCEPCLCVSQWPSSLGGKAEL